MSIQSRLNLAIAALLIFAFGALIAAVALDAGPRLAEENDSVMTLTTAAIQSALPAIEQVANPEGALKTLVSKFAHLRHAKVTLASDGAHVAGQGANLDKGIWDSIFRTATPDPTVIPVLVNGNLIDKIRIDPKPSDEISEVGAAIRRIAQYSLALAAGLIALTSFVVARELRPIHELATAIRAMEHGDFSVRLATKAAPEIATIRDRLNALAQALQSSTEENKRLSARMLHVQDEERREIARDLHDELGPNIFSLRAASASLRKELDRPAPDAVRAAAQARTIIEHVEAIQKTNRRVLNRLSPMGLNELGLAGGLNAIANLWQRERPDIATAVSVSDDVEDLDESTKLTIFRCIQEGLTNAHRHAAATRICASVQLSTANCATGSQKALVSIEDNGIGIPANQPLGFGLTSMKERIRAAGGEFAIESRAGQGAVLRVTLSIAAGS